MGKIENDLKIVRVSPRQIARDERQPRHHFDETALAELADSIAEKGLQQPPTVRVSPAGIEQPFTIVFGERRWRACNMIVNGYTSPSNDNAFRTPEPEFEIDVIVRDLTDIETLQLQLIENLQRQNMTPMEEALAFRRLADEYGQSQNAIAKSTGVPLNRLHRRLKLCRLPQEWQDRLDRGEIPLYVVDLALSVPEDVPSAVPGKTPLEDALEVALAAPSKQHAHATLDRRYTRPHKEARIWASEMMHRERKQYWDLFQRQYCEEESTTGFEVMDYATSRKIFPFEIVDLLPMNARGFAAGESFPDPALDGLAPGRHSDVCWADLAIRYEAPVYIACNGKMGLRAVVRKDLIRQAAELAASDPEDCMFSVSDNQGQQRQAQAAKTQKELDDRSVTERAELASAMMKALDCAVRSFKGAPDPIFWEACFFVAQLGALGFEREDSPMIQVLELLEIDIDREVIFRNFPGLFDSDGHVTADRPAVESLMVCSYTLYYLNEEPGDLLECDVWRDVAEIYQVEIDDILSQAI